MGDKEYVVKDSGERKEFETGAVRDISTGKGRYDLLPLLALKSLAELYEKGAIKYEDNNWLKGIPVSRMMDSAKRHIDQFMLGLEDEDHLIQAVWNLIGAKEYLLRIELGLLPKELDDLPYILREKKDDLG